jgi:hypothetical protein
MIRATLATVALLAVSGCSSPLTPTNTTPTTNFLGGTVNPSGEGYGFILVSRLGTVELTLVSLASVDNPQVTYDVPVRLSLGIYKSENKTNDEGVEEQITSCTDFIGTTVTPALRTQLTSVVNPGDYCAKVTDLNGRLVAPASYVVREVSP